MNRQELLQEIRRVEKALQNTTSRKLQHDYGRYLKRLRNQLWNYDRSMKEWQTRKTCDQASTS